jgi:hypothetical protein
MTGQRTVWIKTIAAFVALATLAPSASAFFPPITPPVIVPPSPTDPIIVVPPVDPIIKPPPKPRPKPDCCCECNPGTANTPEPATLVSAGIGMAVMGAAGWIKRRRKPA